MRGRGRGEGGREGKVGGGGRGEGGGRRRGRKLGRGERGRGERAKRRGGGEGGREGGRGGGGKRGREGEEGEERKRGERKGRERGESGEGGGRKGKRGEERKERGRERKGGGAERGGEGEGRKEAARAGEEREREKRRGRRGERAREAKREEERKRGGERRGERREEGEREGREKREGGGRRRRRRERGEKVKERKRREKGEGDYHWGKYLPLVVVTRAVCYLDRRSIRSRRIDVNRDVVTGIPRCVTVAYIDAGDRATRRDDLDAVCAVICNITTVNYYVCRTSLDLHTCAATAHCVTAQITAADDYVGGRINYNAVVAILSHIASVDYNVGCPAVYIDTSLLYWRITAAGVPHVSVFADAARADDADTVDRAGDENSIWLASYFLQVVTGVHPSEDFYILKFWTRVTGRKFNQKPRPRPARRDARDESDSVNHATVVIYYDAGAYGTGHGLGFTWVKPTVRKRNGTYYDGGPIGDGLGLNKHRRAC